MKPRESSDQNSYTKEWRAKKLGELADFAGGSQPAKRHFQYEQATGFVRLIQIRDFKTDKYATYVPKNLVTKFCDSEDTMIGRYGPPVFQIYRGIEGAYNVALIRATPKDGILKDYLYYFLCQDVLFNLIDRLSRRTSGQTGVDMVALRRYPVLLPPEDTQKIIVTILSTWDQGIDRLERLISAKEQRKRALMQQLLTGKRRYPEFIKLEKVRKTRFGTRPQDWSDARVGDFADQSGERNGEIQDIPVLSCTKHDGLVESLKYFGKRIFSEDTSNYKVVRRDEFAYATNHIEEGSIGVLDFLDTGLVSPMYTVFSTNDTVRVPFLIALFKTELYRHIFEVHTNASVNRRGSLRWNEFKKLHVALPSIEEQDKIVGILDSCDRELSKRRDQLESLRQQKKGLMQKLLTGELRVPINASK